MAARRIVLCADDYALAPGVSAAIRELIGRGRLNATSAMTVTPELRAEAGALAALTPPLAVQIGLHVTLTAGFAPLAANPLTAGKTLFPPLTEYLKPTRHAYLSTERLQQEILAQIAAFRDAFGRAPDFVDGHQHVQLLPAVRGTFVETVARAAPKAWVRQCAPARAGVYLFGRAKERALAWLNLGFRRRAARAGLSSNPAFAGAYDFDGGEEFGTLFRRFLSAMPDGGVVMCHPGRVDSTLRERDPLTDRREDEYRFLASDEMPRALAAADVRLD